jgi:tRNA-splicing ligase RtcB (3'-phosphate/5'-hydroxy nucleic acid ligase)
MLKLFLLSLNHNKIFKKLKITNTKMKLKKLNDYSYEIEKEGNMNVPGKIITSDKLLEALKNDKTLEQIRNVACLPGIYKVALAMPDAHQGYGFSIGGVAAIDRKTGCISPGGIGFDINCGVRLLATSLTINDVEPKIKDLLEKLFISVPSGVGSESKIRLSDTELDEVLNTGVDFAIKKGFGNEDDKLMCEELGRMQKADATKVSPRAKKRGRKQLGTLGAGNHFLEIQVVDEIKDKETAKVFGITQKGQILIMIHCGSRGLGHQVCSDYLRRMEDSNPELMAKLPEKDLIYAPAESKLAQDYFAAMSASANFAWANRHIIAHYVRETFKELFKSAEIKTVYDVAHNIAKEEEYEIDGELREVWTHRKGATRAFGPNHKELPEKYQNTGQPILLPGSMGTSSYILVGSEKAEEETFSSTAHGAGRVMSRFAAKKKYDAQEVKQELELRKIYIKAASLKGISEEAPGVYKDVDEVVRVSHEAGIGNIVAKVIPLGVIKG